ncbi:MAG: DUF72 domain-containing protein [Planctomycetota bacterium]
MTNPEKQLGLFTPPGVPTEGTAGDSSGARIGAVDPSEALRALATAMPPEVYLGTSSWAFPGWADLVYARKATETRLAREGLPAYAACPLHRTVGLDRAFYRPLPDVEYRELAAQVPHHFRFLVKAWQGVTRPDADERGRTQGSTMHLAEHGRRNKRFLDAGQAIDLVIGPALRGLGPKLGPVVFQFPPLDLKRSGPFGGARGFLDQLERFAADIAAWLDGRVKTPVLIAYEVRNRELFDAAHGRRLGHLLRSANACHGFAHHPALPTVASQRRTLEDAGYPLEEQPALVCRWLLRHSQTYTGAKAQYQPFNVLLDADVPARAEIASAVRAALARGATGGAGAWVIANNKAEGSAPITLRRLAAELTQDQSAANG